MYLAVSAGLLATLGSLFGKLAGLITIDGLLNLIVKLACIVIMINANTIGCSCFVKGLQKSGSSLPPTIASTATNYFCSALMGYLVFNESTSLLWWCGTSLVFIGLIIVCWTPTKNTTKFTEKNKDQ